MVNFITSLTFLLTAATSVAAVPHTLEARDDTTCRDDLGDSSYGSVRPPPSRSKSTRS